MTVVLVRNPLDKPVSGVFPPFGVIAVTPGGTADIPDAVWAVWQDRDMWGGQPCPLMAADGGGDAEDAPPSVEEAVMAPEKPAAGRRRRR